MVESTVRVGVIDIGTNSMRLLITDGMVETGRWVEVTGLGRGVDATGRLDEEAVTRTLEVLGDFGRRMNEHGVARRLAIATSASRDAANREPFFDRAESALGVRPVLIDGEREAALAFAGATSGRGDVAGVMVSDIGGGSTEFVTTDRAVSVDIGSVRLTERHLPSRPATRAQLETARERVLEMFDVARVPSAGSVVGVAGTWTSLAAIHLRLDVYDPDRVHGHVMSRSDLESTVTMLSGLTVEETATIPALDPKRAPVILAGGVVAMCVLETTDAGSVEVSERDTLDGAAAELLALA